MERGSLHPPRTLGSFLSFRARENPSLEFAFCKDDSITLGDLNQKSDLVADSLISIGVKDQDRVAIVSHPSLDYLVAEFGIWKAGAICVPINPNLKEREFRYLHSNSGYCAAFVHSDYLPQFIESLKGDKRQIPFFVLGPCRENDEGRKFSSLYSSEKERVDVIDKRRTSPEDIACILYTSGTTGAPKGVVYEHYGLLPFNNETYVQQMMDVIGLSSKDVTFLPFPLYHILGQVHLVGALRNGGRLVLSERFSASRFWEEARKWGATVVVHQGASIPLLLKQPPTSLDKKHNVRISVGAGVPNKKSWMEFEERFGVKIFEHYAQTEGSFFGAGTMPTNKVGTIGPEYFSAEVRVVDEDGNDVAIGNAGQLISRLKEEYRKKRGDDLYYLDPAKGKSRFTSDGWFRSGDIVQKDASGYFHYVGKVETFIRYRGENISPLQIEAVLALNKEIDECIAVGVPNNDLGGDDIKLVVVPKRGVEIEPSEIFKWCESRLPRFMLPRFIEITGELKKSDQTKKVLRHEYTTNIAKTWDRGERRTRG